MDDLRDNVKGGRSFLEKIGKIIPGYSGYKEKLERQEADKLIRDYVVKQLDVQNGLIKDLVDEMTRAMKIKQLDLADRSLKKLEKVRDRIKFADHGYTGWFEPVDIDKNVLDKMYEFDAALVDAAAQLNAEITKARAAVADDDQLKAALNGLYTLIDGIDQGYNQRENFILNK